MSNFIFLDSVWKCLLAITLSSTVIFSISLMGYALIKRVTPGEKLKLFFNYHILFAICSLVIGSIILTCINPELVAQCFDQFATASNSYAITRFIAGGYLISLVIILVNDYVRLLVSSKQHKAFAKVENHQMNEILANLKNHLKIEKPIEILLNEKASSPYVWGLVQHRIVVNPFLLTNEDKNQVATILSHELMHIKGNDSAWLLLSHFAKRVFFFNPLSYLFYSKHRLVVELAADENAIEQCGVEPKTLIRSILEIAESCTKRQDELLQMNVSQEFNEIKERIQSMMGQRKKRVAWVYPALSCASLMFSLIVTTVQTNASIRPQMNNHDAGEIMCLQIGHEKVIENWLRIESPPNKSEMK